MHLVVLQVDHVEVGLFDLADELTEQLGVHPVDEVAQDLLPLGGRQVGRHSHDDGVLLLPPEREGVQQEGGLLDAQVHLVNVCLYLLDLQVDLGGEVREGVLGGGFEGGRVGALFSIRHQ